MLRWPAAAGVEHTLAAEAEHTLAAEAEHTLAAEAEHTLAVEVEHTLAEERTLGEVLALVEHRACLHLERVNPFDRLSLPGQPYGRQPRLCAVVID